MTGFLIVGGTILLLVLALGPAHRRATLDWRPGVDRRQDRDRARLLEELRTAAPNPATATPDASAGRSAGEADATSAA